MSAFKNKLCKSLPFFIQIILYYSNVMYTKDPFSDHYAMESPSCGVIYTFVWFQ